jgi:hypothetical protein
MPRKAATTAQISTQDAGERVSSTPVAKAAKFRLKAPQPLEQTLLAQIVGYLHMEQARRRVAWFARVNGGGMMDRTQRWLAFYWLHLPGAKPISKGMADLHGMLAGGRYFALEVKRPDQSATEAQLRFIETVRTGGGIAAVVRDYREVKTLLFGESE